MNSHQISIKDDLDKKKLKEVLNFILNQLDEYKAEEVVYFDVDSRSDVTCYVIIASGKSSKHILSIAENILSDLALIEYSNIRIEGRISSTKWLLLDLGGILVHIFHPELRKIYKIEELCEVTSIDNLT